MFFRLFFCLFLISHFSFASEQNLSLEKTKSSLIVKQRATSALILLQVDPEDCQIPLEVSKRKEVLNENNKNYQESGILPACEIESVKSIGKTDVEDLKDESKKLKKEISIVDELLGDIQDRSEQKKAIEIPPSCVLSSNGDMNLNKKENSSSQAACQSFCEEKIKSLDQTENYYATCSFEGKLIFDEIKGDSEKKALQKNKIGTCEINVEGSGFYRYVKPGHPAYYQPKSEIEKKSSFPIFSMGECERSCHKFERSFMSKLGGRAEQDYKVTCTELVAGTVITTKEISIKATTLHRLSEYPSKSCSAYLIGVDRAGKPYSNVKTNSSVQGEDCADFCEDVYSENLEGPMRDMQLEMRCKEEDKMILTCNDGYGCS